MSVTAASVRRLVLPATLLLALLLCSSGITATILHPDQMALLPVFREGLAPFNPGWFERPPFHTYTNYFLAVAPASALSDALGLASGARETLTLVWSRVVSSLLFAAGVALFHAIVRRVFCSFGAALSTLLLATSAGLVAHAHFLTADVPVASWMLAAFFFSQRVLLDARLSSYLLAGCFTGIATATKYNGLAVGLAIPAAHYLHHYYLEKREFRLFELVLPTKLVLGIACVALGFVAANPFSVLDHRTFVHDFVHNYKVAPVYEGQTGASYGRFFVAMTEVVGVPGFLLLAAGWAGSLALALRAGVSRREKAFVAMAALVVAVYYAKFAPFPRLETRFVLPIVPIAALVPALALARIRACRPVVALVLLVAGYNAVCALVTGQRFHADPRLTAARWLDERVPARSVVEVDVYSPAPAGADGMIEVVAMPFVSGRERLFARLFAGDPFVLGAPDYYRQIEKSIRWYSAEALAERAPDFVVVDSLYYARFVEPGPRRSLHPTLAEFFTDLVTERLGYRTVFDAASPPVPCWLYPRRLDFQQNRVTVLAKQDRS